MICCSLNLHTVRSYSPIIEWLTFMRCFEIYACIVSTIILTSNIKFTLIKKTQNSEQTQCIYRNLNPELESAAEK